MKYYLGKFLMNFKMYKWILLCILVELSHRSSGARILSLIPFTGKSHYINIQPILQKLAERGHELTVVTTHYEKNPLPNYKQIILDNRTFWDSFGKNHDKFGFASMPFYKEIVQLWDGTYFSTEVAFNSTSLQKFIQEDNSQFDLIFIELFYQEAFYLFAHKYKAPIVAMNTMGFTQYIGEFMGNPLELSYMPHEFLALNGGLNVWKRMENVFNTIYDLLGRRFYVLPRHERLLNRHFTNLPKPWPSLHELEQSVSVVLLNSHYSLDVVRPYLPGIVEIGGVHIRPTKTLPKSLQSFLDSAEDGAIYFSLGSNLRSADMPKAKIEMFLKVFSRLKQKVLWKWEEANLPGQPDNVFIDPWLPQSDVLNHPNVRIFITHGGLLSTLEAVNFGKPIIGIPVFGDQHINTAKAEQLGIGVKLAFTQLSEEAIENAINKILSNNTYSEVAKTLSKRFRDRETSPMDTAIFWIEYVIRHNGAPFMRSPVLKLKWYEYYMIDILLIAFLSLLVIVFIVKYILISLCKLFKNLLQTSKRKIE